MQTTSRIPRATTSPTRTNPASVFSTGATRTKTGRFGHFSPVVPPAAPAHMDEPGHTAIEDAAALLSLFDPRAEPAGDAVRGPVFADNGEHLPPLVPPVISAAGRQPVVADPVLRTSTLARRSMGAPPVPLTAGSRAIATSPGSTRRGRLRMTLRGRVVAVLFVAAAVAGISALAGPDAPAAETATAGVELVEVEVHEGDTVSSIAHATSKGQDSAVVVSAIQDANDLDVSPDTALEPGSIVLVPAS